MDPVTPIALERLAFEEAGVTVSDLSDAQVHEATERIVDKYGGIVPDLHEIEVEVDVVRFLRGLRLVPAYEEGAHER